MGWAKSGNLEFRTFMFSSFCIIGWLSYPNSAAFDFVNNNSWHANITCWLFIQKSEVISVCVMWVKYCDMVSFKMHMIHQIKRNDYQSVWLVIQQFMYQMLCDIHLCEKFKYVSAFKLNKVKSSNKSHCEMQVWKICVKPSSVV